MAAKASQDPSAPLVALSSFVGALDDHDVRFIAGEPVSADNPAVAKWPQLFGPQVFRHDLIARIESPVVEQATAAPGEKRA